MLLLHCCVLIHCAVTQREMILSGEPEKCLLLKISISERNFLQIEKITLKWSFSSPVPSWWWKWKCYLERIMMERKLPTRPASATPKQWLQKSSIIKMKMMVKMVEQLYETCEESPLQPKLSHGLITFQPILNNKFSASIFWTPFFSIIVMFILNYSEGGSSQLSQE